MKKLIALIIAACLCFALFVGCNADNGISDEENTPAGSAAVAASPAAESAPAVDATAAPVEVTVLDHAALYQSRDADEIVASVDGHDITWQEYFYWLYNQASQIQSFINQMALYSGERYGWADPVMQGSDETYSDVAVENAGVMLCQLYGIEKYCEKNGITLSAEDEAALVAQLESDIVTLAGEGATEDDFNAKLDSVYMTRALYDRVNRIEPLYNAGFAAQYGENGEKISDKEAIQYLEDNGYLAANHILLLTSDMQTGEELSAEEKAERKAQAEKLSEELNAIEDAKERAARFSELKEQYDEDTGKLYYPDGMVFTEGTMVAEFEEATKSLEAGEVSGVVETPYGYHIIMRLAHDADRTVSYSSDGTTAYNARYICAGAAYSEAVEAVVSSVSISYAEGFAVNLADYTTTVTQ